MQIIQDGKDWDLIISIKENEIGIYLQLGSGSEENR